MDALCLPCAKSGCSWLHCAIEQEKAYLGLYKGLSADLLSCTLSITRTYCAALRIYGWLGGQPESYASSLCLLDWQARIAILEVHARDKKMAPDADFHKIARATGGFSGAQLMNLMNVAAINAVQRGASSVSTEDMFTVSFCTYRRSCISLSADPHDVRCVPL